MKEFQLLDGLIGVLIRALIGAIPTVLAWRSSIAANKRVSSSSSAARIGGWNVTLGGRGSWNPSPIARSLDASATLMAVRKRSWPVAVANGMLA
jgi:hypothetical protein